MGRNWIFLLACVAETLWSSAGAVRFTIEPTSVVVGEEEPGPLVCAVEGSNYKISWRDKKGIPLETSRWKKKEEAFVSNWHYEDVSGSNLFVMIWSKQKTKFTCVVSDGETGAEIATRDAYLSRDRSLEMGDGSHENLKGYVGAAIPMDCGLDGVSTSEVYWFKKSKDSAVRTYVYTPGEERARNKLIVYPSDVTDLAHYTCYYLNEKGELQKGTRVWLGALRPSPTRQFVHPPTRRPTPYSPPIRTLKPTGPPATSTTTQGTTTSQQLFSTTKHHSLVEITSTYIDTKESSEQKRRLICEASGSPRPSIFWLRQRNGSKKLGSQFFHDNDDFNVRSTLLIGALSRPENFTCVAKQHQHQVSQVLFVQPETLPAPRIKNTPALDETGKFVLVEWEPVPSVERYVLYVTINNTEPAQPYVIEKKRSSFELLVEPFTEYSAYLTAEDVYDRKSFGSTTFEFAGPRRPGDVTHLSALLTDAGSSAKLKWTPVNVPDVLYDVYFTSSVPPSPDLFHWRMVSDVAEAFYEFGDELQLRPGDHYSFIGKVKAKSKYDFQSKGSNIATLILPLLEKLPLPAVEELPSSPLSRNISWLVPEDLTSTPSPSAFQLRLSSVGSNEFELFNSTERFFLLKDLQFGEYVVEVRAVSQKHLGPWSEGAHFALLDLEPVEKFHELILRPSITELYVQWDWPGEEQTLSNFVISVSEKISGVHVAKNIFPASTRSAFFKKLQPETEFLIIVTANGKNGQRTSVQNATTTLKSIDLTPVDVIPLQGESSVTMIWRLPSKKVKELTGIKIRSKRPNEKWTETETFDANEVKRKLELEPDSNYLVQVGAVLSSGLVQWSAASEVHSGPTNSPSLSRPVDVSGKAVTVFFEPPSRQQNPNDFQIKIYRMMGNAPTSVEDHFFTIDGERRQFRFDKLAWGFEYQFRIVALGGSHKSNPLTVIVAIETIAPLMPPPGVQVFSSEERITITWGKLPSDRSGGHITSYNIRWRLATPKRSRRMDPKDWPLEPGFAERSVHSPRFNLTLDNRADASEYCGEQFEFSVSAINKEGSGPYSSPMVGFCGLTRVIAQNLRVVEVGSNWAQVIWDRPQYHKHVQKFLIYYSINDEQPEQDTLERDALSFKIQKLAAGVHVRFKVVSITMTGSDQKSQVVEFTTTPTVSDVIRIDKVNPGGVVNITLPFASFGSGVSPTRVSVIVTSRSDTRPDDITQELFSGVEKAEASSWIVAQWRYEDFMNQHAGQPFVIGGGGQTQGIENKNLPPGVFFAFVRLHFRNAVNNWKHSSTRLSQPIHVIAEAGSLITTTTELGTIIIAAMTLAFVFISAIVFFVVRRRMSGDKPYLSGIKRSDEYRASEHVSPVKAPSNHSLSKQATELSSMLVALKANGGLKLHDEWHLIQAAEEMPAHAQQKSLDKCRYGNSNCPDHSRVQLNSGEFIHANWIEIDTNEKAIATQGPLENTIADFWQMTWENNVSCIVMLCELEERGRSKCVQYWPEKDMGDAHYGSMTISLIDESHLAFWSISRFNLANGSQTREVNPIRFHGWPDCGVPEFPAQFLALLERLPKAEESKGPIVAHCSAGLGRTGCLLLAVAMLKRANRSMHIEPVELLKSMRIARPGLVQSEEQYIFVVESVVEALSSCNLEFGTQIQAREIPKTIERLSSIAHASGSTGFEDEFKRLQMMPKGRVHAQAASLACNKKKNRLVNVLPYDSSRVYLRPIRGIEGSDYINASFIDGYKEKGAYIATQAPMTNTTDDFWRMIWENNVTMIVMLTQLSELGREKCTKYWPEGKKARYTYYIVESTTEFCCEGFVMREFLMTDARDGTSRTVRQFHFISWPEGAEVPAHADNFIDLIGQVHKTREQFGVVGPICVHCSAGVGRTGVFIGLTVILERLRSEGEVDIFQTVKLMRCRRPGMIQTAEQYQFIYRATLEYLQNFYLGGT